MDIDHSEYSEEANMYIGPEGLEDNTPPFIVYGVYYDPGDYPDLYVVRRWVDEVPDTKALYIGKLLTEARAVIPDGLFNMGQDPIDKKIIETWI